MNIMRKSCRLLAKQLGISIFTLDIYLCRSEFSHIKKKRRMYDKEAFYENLNSEDIKKIKEFIKFRRTKKIKN